jgi:leucyl aminopeptidase
MLADLTQVSDTLSNRELTKLSHTLCLFSNSEKISFSIPGSNILDAQLKRRYMKTAELAKTPVSANTDEGGLIVWAIVDLSKSAFEQQTQVRKALALLLAENPKTLNIAVFGAHGEKHALADLAVYTAWINATPLPNRKSKKETHVVQKIVLHGYQSKNKFAEIKARVEGNYLTRELTVLPPNELTPQLYRNRVKKLAKEKGWKYEEFDMPALRKMKAGAFVAVAQGSDPEDAAIVHLQYRSKAAKKSIALVGKGICFDTGGHNLKPARYMLGMHEDMNGSAVVLGILNAATLLKLPVNIDAWLAIAQNHISPKAYKQNDVVTALNGTTIEIIHTDAEGRMVLSDTLFMATQEKPDLVIDFATLTGSMAVALGDRYSGIFSNRVKWIERAIDAGQKSGERVNAFPLDDDYDPGLDSKIADVKQCSMDGKADHILAARFLQRFINDTPWIHMDLSASNCEGGLGAVGTDITGFGVNWAVTLLADI